MKSLKSYLTTAVTALIACILTAGCESDGKYTYFQYPEPTVEGIKPARGYTGSQMMILGKDFGDRTEAVKVFFGEIPATILSCKNNMIVVKVPVDAQSSDVTVKVWQYDFPNFAHFEIAEKPTVTSVRSSNATHPSFAQTGDIVTITGSSFGTDPEEVQVTFGLVNAKVQSVKDDEIKAITPAGYAYGPVSVTVGGFECVGDRLVDPDHVGDMTSYALANSTQPFASTDDAPEDSWYLPSGWKFNDAFYFVNADGDRKMILPMLSTNGTGDWPLGVIGFLSNQWANATHKNPLVNAKMYQNVFLPKGTYKITAEISECMNLGGTLEVILGVTKGYNTLPDMSGPEYATGWKVNDESAFFSDGNGGKSYAFITDDKAINVDPIRGDVPVSFTCRLDENSDVTIGFVANVKMLNGTSKGCNVFMSNIYVERLK